MKKILGLAMAAALLVSCSNDDGPTVTMSKLTGQKWYYSSYKVAGQTIPYDDNEACGKDYMLFNADGTVDDIDVWDCEEYSYTSTYTVSGKTLTIIDDGEDGEDSETIDAKVKELTSKKLVLEDVFDYDGNGTDETVLVIFTSN